MTFAPLGDTLHDKSKKTNDMRHAEDEVIVENTQKVLEELFGADLAKDAKPLFLKNRTVTISCASSAIAQKIRENQAEIVDNINKKLGDKQVDRIRYLA